MEREVYFALVPPGDARLAVDTLNLLLRKAREVITRYLYTILAIACVWYVLFAVPQISNLWMQFPPIFGGWAISLMFALFVTCLAAFYLASLWVNQGWESLPAIRARLQGRQERERET